MLSPRVLIWIILVSLGAAAVLGAAGVLLGGEDFVWRGVGTSIVTAICCGLLFWVTRKLTDQAGSAAAMLATILIVLEFVLSLTLIWEINEKLFSIKDEYIGELVFIFGALAIPAVVCVRYLRHPEGWIACIAGLFFCAAVLVVWMIGMDSSGDRWWESGGFLAGFGLLAIFSLVGVGVDRRYWRWIGVIAAAVGGYIGILSASKNIYSDRWPEFPMTVLTGIAVWIAHANLAVRCPLKSGQKWIAYGSICATGLSMGFWIASVWSRTTAFSGSMSNDTMLSRLASAFGIIAVCGSVALMILWRINLKPMLGKREQAEALNVAALRAAVVCPTCQTKLMLGNAETACPGCGLQMKLILEEPRCQACGYSLLMNSSDRCPECGAVKSLLPIAAV